MNAKTPDQDVEHAIGHAVRIARVSKGISQSKMAKEIGVTYQQLQKYEAGENRMAASRLQQIAKYLSVPISVFFDIKPNEVDEGLLARRKTMELIRNFYACTEAVQKTVFVMAREHADRRKIA